jgi:polyisoprenoid-binding protein YceI
MKLRNLAMLAALVSALVAPTAAGAATVTPNSRVNCNCFTSMGATLCFCYFSGTVTFSNASNTLSKVELYVAGTCTDMQSSGFGHNLGSTTWLYGKCATAGVRAAGSAEVRTVDMAYMPGHMFPVAEGVSAWSP